MELHALWDFEDPAGSVERFAQARAATSGPKAACYATQQARALGLLGRFDEAHRLLDALADDDPEVAARIHLERGRLQRSAATGDRGAAEFAQAVTLTEQRRDETPFGGLLIDALHMLALLPADPVEQIERTRLALRAAEAAVDPEAGRWRASLFNNLGCAQHEAGDDEAALASFRQAHVLREVAGEPREAQIARYMVAWALRLLGRFDEAQELFEELQRDLRADGRDDSAVRAELERIAARSTADG